jgi:molybdopterin converting factor small subunit
MVRRAVNCVKTRCYDRGVRVRLLAFASASDALGGAEGAIELPSGSTLRDLRAALGATYPALAPLLPRLAIAVDGEVANDGDLIPEGSDVALLPPVSGG